MATNPYLNPPEENEQMALAKWLELHKIRYTLARIGLAYLGYDTDLIKPQLEVIRALKKAA